MDMTWVPFVNDGRALGLGQQRVAPADLSSPSSHWPVLGQVGAQGYSPSDVTGAARPLQARR
jgi:hypothetical protein